jgi:hypothetical protein
MIPKSGLFHKVFKVSKVCPYMCFYKGTLVKRLNHVNESRETNLAALCAVIHL